MKATQRASINECKADKIMEECAPQWSVHGRLAKARAAAVEMGASALISFQRPHDGQYRFVATSYEELLKRCSELHPSIRHFYEVMPEGHAARLYLDIEYPRMANPTHDGDTMMEEMLQDLRNTLRRHYGDTIDEAGACCTLHCSAR